MEVSFPDSVRFPKSRQETNPVLPHHNNELTLNKAASPVNGILQMDIVLSLSTNLSPYCKVDTGTVTHSQAYTEMK